jgi:hypothetical protein
MSYYQAENREKRYFWQKEQYVQKPSCMKERDIVTKQQSKVQMKSRDCSHSRRFLTAPVTGPSPHPTIFLSLSPGFLTSRVCSQYNFNFTSPCLSVPRITLKNTTESFSIHKLPNILTKLFVFAVNGNFAYKCYNFLNFIYNI